MGCPSFTDLGFERPSGQDQFHYAKLFNRGLSLLHTFPSMTKLDLCLDVVISDPGNVHPGFTCTGESCQNGTPELHKSGFRATLKSMLGSLHKIVASLSVSAPPRVPHFSVDGKAWSLSVVLSNSVDKPSLEAFAKNGRQ